MRLAKPVLIFFADGPRAANRSLAFVLRCSAASFSDTSKNLRSNSGTAGRWSIGKFATWSDNILKGLRSLSFGSKWNYMGPSLAANSPYNAIRTAPQRKVAFIGCKGSKTSYCDVMLMVCSNCAVEPP